MSRSLTRRRFTVLGVGLGLALAACSGQVTKGEPGQSTGATPAVTVRLVMKDYVFEPARLVVPAGTPVTLVVVNEGEVLHEVEVKGLFPETELIPGQTWQTTITAEKKTYKLYCEMHEDLKMVGELVGE